MATRKQKHARALAKREEFLETEREIARRALEQDHAERARKERAEWQDNHDKNHGWTKRIVECPLCRDLMSPATIAALEKAKKLSQPAPTPTKTQQKKLGRRAKSDA
jgi:hypothetical protein